MSDAGMFMDESFMDESEFNMESKKDRRFRIIIISSLAVLAILLLGEFIGWRYIKPSLSSPKVTISGYETLSAEDVAVKLIPLSNRNWFTFDVNTATSILSSESSIKFVSVEKHFPDKILINIVERTPVAVTYVSQNGKSVAMQIDEQGVLFSNKNNALAAQSGMPIVSGIPVENMTGGMRIPSTYRPLIDQIAKIRELPQKYFAGISEICVLPKEYGNYELALIPAQSRVKVLTDRALNEDALKYMMVALDIVNQIGTDDVAEVDLRYGSVSYRTK